MFSQVFVCPQLVSWLLIHYSALLQYIWYASYWNAFFLVNYNYLYFILFHTCPRLIHQIQWIQQNFKTGELECRNALKSVRGFASHSQTKLLNCSQLLGHVADQNYTYSNWWLELQMFNSPGTDETKESHYHVFNPFTVDRARKTGLFEHS